MLTVPLFLLLLVGLLQPTPTRFIHDSLAHPSPPPPRVQPPLTITPARFTCCCPVIDPLQGGEYQRSTPAPRRMPPLATRAVLARLAFTAASLVLCQGGKAAPSLNFLSVRALSISKFSPLSEPPSYRRVYVSPPSAHFPSLSPSPWHKLP